MSPKGRGKFGASFHHIGVQEISPGSDYTDEERRFVIACDQFRRKMNRKFMAARDYLRVAKELGYAILNVPTAVKPTAKP